MIPDDFHIWADENEPLVMRRYEVYNVTIPSSARQKLGQNNYPWVHLNVYEDGLVNIDNNSHWFKEYNFNEHLVRREIWEWLQEWELVEKRAIGPEDYEYFITDNFVQRSEIE